MKWADLGKCQSGPFPHFDWSVLHSIPMTIASAPARWLGSLAFCFLSCVNAQTWSSDPVPELPPETFEQVPGQLLPPEQLPASPLRFEQAWDVVELMGQPMLTDAQRPARVLLRPQGGLWVDGGCNYFSGSIERDPQGLFRVFRYGGTHGGCEKPPRSEAFLNSALVMIDNYRWDRGLVLRSGAKDLIRLVPSANQDSAEFEPALASRVAVAAPHTAAPAQASRVVEQNCQQVKPSQSRKAKGKRAVSQPRLVCKPVAKPSQLAGKSRTAKPGSKVKSAARRR